MDIKKLNEAIKEAEGLYDELKRVAEIFEKKAEEKGISFNKCADVDYDISYEIGDVVVDIADDDIIGLGKDFAIMVYPDINSKGSIFEKGLNIGVTDEEIEKIILEVLEVISKQV